VVRSFGFYYETLPVEAVLQCFSTPVRWCTGQPFAGAIFCDQEPRKRCKWHFADL